MAAIFFVRVCFNTRVLRGELTHAGTLVSSPVGPPGDLSETRGEAWDVSQILSDRGENKVESTRSSSVDA